MNAKVPFPVKFIASLGFTGYSPLAPGTVGSALTLIVLWFVDFTWLGAIIAASILFLIGVWVSTIAEREWGHDARRINVDEAVGMIITLIVSEKQISIYIVAFVLFRIFDVLKPFPINISQKLPAGWGVMIDDVIAGIYGSIILVILFRVIL